MINNQVKFKLYERADFRNHRGNEWVLSAKLGDNDPWTMETWELKPKKEVVANTKQIIMRAFEFYYKNLQIPHFEC